jgi:hypothetical protein
MKEEWEYILYEKAMKAGDLNAMKDWIHYKLESFPIDDKIIDKVPRIPIKFNT